MSEDNPNDQGALDFTGAMTMARGKGNTNATREIRPGGRLEATNRTLARGRSGSGGSRIGP
jgi:hypothetical protein